MIHGAATIRSLPVIDTASLPVLSPSVHLAVVPVW